MAVDACCYACPCQIALSQQYLAWKIGELWQPDQHFKRYIPVRQSRYNRLRTLAATDAIHEITKRLPLAGGSSD